MSRRQYIDSTLKQVLMIVCFFFRKTFKPIPEPNSLSAQLVDLISKLLDKNMATRISTIETLIGHEWVPN